MSKQFLKWYRQLPWFKGKLRMGKFFFKEYIWRKEPVLFRAHHQIYYNIPNTLENLGVELMINGVYEHDIVKFLQEHVPAGSVFFDIGANIGSLGLPVVKLKEKIQYYGFEASPEVFRYLKYNFEKNCINQFELHNVLVHNAEYQSVKFYQGELYGKSSMAPTYSNEHVLVDSISMDSFCRNKSVEKINWMKVDVQGFELNVFEGMYKMLREKRVENILFEFEEWADRAAGIEAGSAQRYLEKMGYVLYGLDGSELKFTKVKNDTMIWAKPGENH